MLNTMYGTKRHGVSDGTLVRDHEYEAAGETTSVSRKATEIDWARLWNFPMFAFVRRGYIVHNNLLYIVHSSLAQYQHCPRYDVRITPYRQHQPWPRNSYVVGTYLGT